MPGKLTIGITDCSKYNNYANWLLLQHDEIEIIKLGYRYNNFDEIRKCRGLLLTGGEDVNPDFFGKPEYYEYCYKEDVDEQRDQFELHLMEYTEKKQLPVLGICRGLQIANVFFGGTLIPDIPTWGKTSHSKLADGTDSYHPVEIAESSWFYKLVNTSFGLVNSNHHQCAEDIGEGLHICGTAPEDIPEVLERTDTSKSFLCLVQWHPERMKHPESPFSKNLREAFVEAVRTNN
jgi:putative glutamine amidotransferase